MPENHRVFLRNMTILVLLIVISTCNGYHLYRDSSNAIRPLKYHILNDPDRMKQYHNTVGQSRLWRRYPEDFNDDALQEFLRRYK